MKRSLGASLLCLRLPWFAPWEATRPGAWFRALGAVLGRVLARLRHEGPPPRPLPPLPPPERLALLVAEADQAAAAGDLGRAAACFAEASAIGRGATPGPRGEAVHLYPVALAEVRS